MTDGQPMEVEALSVLAPEQAVSPPAAALCKKTPLPSDATSTAKRRAARRKTLCDITNLTNRDPADATGVPDESACLAAPELAPASPGSGVEEFAELVKKNEELVRLLAERDEIIQVSGAEIEKLRAANWELARANSQMMAEVSHGRNALKALQHALACSTASLKAKASELEDAKKTMLRRNAPVQRTQNPGPDRAAQTKDGDVLDAEPASDASRARSIQRSGNASRKRVLRSRSLGPTTAAKLTLPKDMDRDASQRRKSMRTPQTSSHTDDLFEIEDVQLAISSCKIDPESASGSDKPGHQFLRRSSLGRPLRQARGVTTSSCKIDPESASGSDSDKPGHQFLRRSSLGRPVRHAAERVTSYKETPLHVKLRRP